MSLYVQRRIAELKAALRAERQFWEELERRLTVLLLAIKWFESQSPCPCGADPRHRDTHPHTADCPVGAALALDGDAGRVD